MLFLDVAYVFCDVLVLNRQSDSCVGAHSRLIQLFVYDATAFYNVSGYCFLTVKFPVVPPPPRCQKVGDRKKLCSLRSQYTSPLSKTWRRPGLYQLRGIGLRLCSHLTKHVRPPVRLKGAAGKVPVAR